MCRVFEMCTLFSVYCIVYTVYTLVCILSTQCVHSAQCFRGFDLSVSEYCPAVWCSAADTHLKLLYRVVSGESFSTGLCLSLSMHIVDLWQYYVCWRRWGVTWCILFIVLFLSRVCRCVLNAVLWAHIGTLNYAPPRCRTGVPQDIYSHVSVSVERFWWPRIRWCWTGGFQEQGQCPFIGLAALPFCLLPLSLSLLLFYLLVLWGYGLRTDRVLITRSQSCTASLFK